MDLLKDYITEEQIFGLIFFVAGVFLLNLCAKWERKDYLVARDPKLKWEYIDKDSNRQAEVRQKSTRGWIMTLIGLGLALYGAVTFFMNIK